MRTTGDGTLLRWAVREEVSKLSKLGKSFYESLALYYNVVLVKPDIITKHLTQGSRKLETWAVRLTARYL